MICRNISVKTKNEKIVTRDDIRHLVFQKEAEEGLDISNRNMVLNIVKKEFGEFVDMKMVEGMM